MVNQPRALQGRKVVITASRKTEEMCTILYKLGATPVLYPTMSTMIHHDNQTEKTIEQFSSNGADWFLFTTGIGAERIFDVAKRINRGNAFLQGLQNCFIGARGYKTIQYIQQLGIQPHAKATDGTTQGLMAGMESFRLNQKNIFLQLAGAPSPSLIDWLKQREANVHTLLPYEHICVKPERMQPLVEEILHRQVDAITFTSSPQVVFLFDYVRNLGLLDEFLCACNDIAIAAVGKVTGETLREQGITRIIIPEQERMGAMLIALARHFAC